MQDSGFDNPQPVLTNADAPAFREQSRGRVQELLQAKLSDIRTAVQKKDGAGLRKFVTGADDDINRAVVGANPQENIFSTPDTAIMHAFGIPLWRKPKDIRRLETETTDALVDSFVSGQVDVERFGKGVYFQKVLLHKYKNGNGRVARGMRAVIGKSSDATALTSEETSQVLGIGREGVTQTGEHSYKINFNPDFERLVLGVAYFGLHKGLSQEQVIGDLKLNGTLPEEGLKALAQKLGTPSDQLKDEFVRFMVVDSDLEWCKFD